MSFSNRRDYRRRPPLGEALMKQTGALSMMDQALVPKD